MPSQGATTDRGYGSQHQRRRTQWEPHVATGTINCQRCNTPIHPNQEWDLGHQNDRSAPTFPEHARRHDCPAGGNRSTGGRPTYHRPTEPHPGIRHP